MRRKIVVTANDGAQDLRVEVVLKANGLTRFESDRVAKAAGNLIADAIRGMPMCSFAPDNTRVRA
jgi:hypothetical protein